MRCASTAPRSSRTGMLVCSYLLVYSLSNYFTHRLSGFLIAAHGAVFAVLVFWGWYLLLAVLTTLNPHIRRGPGRRQGS